MSIREKTGPGGKDLVIFATKEDHASPSTIKLDEIEPSPGLILPNGDINWNCPCLGGMATGPCGVQFREAFSCFHYSEADPKGSDCFESFTTMQNCMLQYPTIYNKDTTGDDPDEMNYADPSNDDMDLSGDMKKMDSATSTKLEKAK